MIVPCKSIPGYEGLYEVDSQGNVFSYKYGDKRKLKPGNSSGGYMTVTLTKDAKEKTYRVHTLVLLTFVGQPPEGKTHARHLDGNPKNNALENLAWGSRSENERDKQRHGRANFVPGEKHQNSKLTDAERGFICSLKTQGFSQSDIAKAFGVSQSRVSTMKLTENTQTHVRI